MIVGVAGGTGSGKTTVSEEIRERVGRDLIVYLQHDSYYRDRSHLSAEERAELNFDHPDALETDLLVEHLRALRQGRAVEVPVYDFTRHVRKEETRTLRPRPVVLVEGILVLAEEALRRQMDVKLYVDTDADLRFIRRLRRDLSERGRTLDSVVEQYLEDVRPMHLEFVEPSKRYADLIIPEGGSNTVALDAVVAQVERMLEREGRAPRP